MADKDYGPLSTSCVRALNDKLYEKRKVAALEIERMVKEFAATSNSQQIRRLLSVLGQDFARSQNPNSRKGGLIGLAATAIALGKESGIYVQELVKPVLACFHDADSRVRYFSCEALYNIVKVARGSVLPFFNDIFNGLSNLAADPDQNVRNGSELLDRLMKDIVTESCAFDMVAFMPLIRGRIYTKNPYARQFLVAWIMTLESVPDINMIVFLPEILDGLFNILGDPNLEIRKMCEGALGEFLQGINRNKSKAVNYSAMVNILITHSQSTDAIIQFTAITWIKEFIQLSGRTMLPFASGILTAALPCLSYEENSLRSTREVARVVNTSLMRLVTSEDDVLSDSVQQYISCAARAVNNSLMKLAASEDLASPELGVQFPPAGSDAKKSADQEAEDSKDSETEVSPETTSNTGNICLDIPSIVQVLTRQLLHDSMHTRIASLRWIYHLYIKTPNKIFLHVEELFPLLLKTLSDPSDEVVLLDLEVLAEISSSSAGKKYPSRDSNNQLGVSATVQKAIESSHSMNGYFTNFMLSLLKLFSTDRQLLEDRGSFIIRQLCLLLQAEDIYKCFSEILLHEEDMKFAAVMIQTLSTILLTSTELFELRTQLKDLKTPESCALFCCLYKSWCHNPVSTVALCFLTQNYHHACDLLPLFGDLEVTVDFLTEIDKLVQLIESPIFTYLRLQLLDVEHNQHLIKSLYGLLMLLPQTDAFRTLQHRLQCIPNIQFLPAEKRVQNANNSPAKRPALKNIKFDDLLQHFKVVQERHRAARRQPRTIADLDRKYGYS